MLSKLKTTLVEIILIKLKKYNKNVIVTKKLDKYISELVVNSTTHDVIQEFNNAAKLPNGSYQTPIVEVRLLEFLVKIGKSKRILEVGTFRGLTSLALAKAGGSDCTVTTCEINEENAYFARQLWEKNGVSEQINLLLGDAVVSLEDLVSKGLKFDFIYIDADKKQYLKYFELALSLSEKGTVVAIDNTLWAGLVTYKDTKYSHAKLIAELNSKAFSTFGSNVTIVPAWDGLLLVLI